MSNWHQEDFGRDLDRLLRHARANARRGQDVFTETEPLDGRILRWSGEGQLTLIEGTGLPLLRSLQRRIVGSSRVAFGMSLDEARALLIATCEEAVARTIKGAVSSLIDTLESEPEEMTIAEAVRAVFPPGKFTVGRTDYWSHAPRWIGDKAVREGFAAQQGFVAPIAVTRLLSRGFTTGLVLARQRFTESAAVLDLASPPQHLGSEAYWISAGPGQGGLTFRRAGWILNAGLLDEHRHLRSPYGQLALVANKDEDDRSDWQQRVLAATRWYSQAYRSEWSAARLSGVMSALECLFVPAGQTKNLGGTIAARFTERFRMHEFSTGNQQRRWLSQLYEGRKRAVHEGREYRQDIDLDRLLDVTRLALRSMAVHLIPGHRPIGRSCRSFAEAIRCSAPPAARRQTRRHRTG